MNIRLFLIPAIFLTLIACQAKTDTGNVQHTHDQHINDQHINDQQKNDQHTRDHNQKNQTNLKLYNEDVSYYYTCPMHPDIKQNKPGLCPECNMKLEKVEIKQ
jgi:hypothetical protein